MLKNIAQCPRPGLEPGPLAPETSAITTRPAPFSNSKRVVADYFLLAKNISKV